LESGGEPGRAVRFGAFEADLVARELRRGGVRVRLQEQPFQVLARLLERPGEVVSREDLRSTLWPGDTFVDFDDGLNAAIRRLRDALGDDADRPRFVETLSRRGYRFVAPVNTPASPPAQRRLSARDALLLAGALAALVMAAFVLAERRPISSPATRTPVRLAVLPFANLSGDPEQEYFSDGLTEEMIARLGRLASTGLRVTARTSVMRYKGAAQGASQIGRELGVAYLLEGSVRREAGRVRISARLIDVSEETHLWTETYERDATGVLAIQNEVAERVARSLAMTLLPGSVVRSITTNPPAYEAYLRGRQAWNRRTPASFEKALRYFQQAIALDPQYAAAHAGLADTYGLLCAYAYAVVPPREAMPRAREAARRAIALDETLAEAQASLGWVSFVYEWDWAAAESALRRAIALNPSYATGHLWYSRLLAARGRLDESLAEARLANELDPLSPMHGTRIGSHLYLARRFDEAVAAHRRTIELEPEFGVAHLELGLTHLARGAPEEASAALRRARELLGESTMPLAFLGRALAESGRQAEARQVLAELQALSRARFVPAFNIAVVQLGLGQRDAAVASLRRACEERFYSMVFLKVDPVFDAVRADPAFGELVRCVGLEP
jgi:TolB-like protein/DNA-binding winged helix-turn-helix (wHTH) protein/Tfp pilus assembly protein PilF